MFLFILKYISMVVTTNTRTIHIKPTQGQYILKVKSICIFIRLTNATCEGNISINSLLSMLHIYH